MLTHPSLFFWTGHVQVTLGDAPQRSRSYWGAPFGRRCGFRSTCSATFPQPSSACTTAWAAYYKPKCWAPPGKAKARNLSHGTIQFFFSHILLVVYSTTSLAFKPVSYLFTLRKVTVAPSLQKRSRLTGTQPFWPPTFCICPFYTFLLLHWKKLMVHALPLPSSRMPCWMNDQLDLQLFNYSFYTGLNFCNISMFWYFFLEFLLQWNGVEDPALLQLWHRLHLWRGFNPRPRNFHMAQVWPKKKNK